MCATPDVALKRSYNALHHLDVARIGSFPHEMRTPCQRESAHRDTLAVMGTLTYDSKLTVSLDDRVLAHLQPVIWSKLRRGEPFSFTWTDPMRPGLGRTSVWLSPNIPLAFEYFGSRAPRLNPLWLDALSKAANSPTGLSIVPEPEAPEAP